MKQETGETRNAIIEDDEKVMQKILYANRNRKKPYWIVLFATPSKYCVDGKPTLMKHIKAYSNKPSAKVGMVVGKVNNRTGEISWDVNMPQKPFDFDALAAFGAETCDEEVVETTSIPGAYITK